MTDKTERDLKKAGLETARKRHGATPGITEADRLAEIRRQQQETAEPRELGRLEALRRHQKEGE